jgi:hypothetical protein
MVKMIYISNTIRIPTHGVNLWHHGLGFGGRSPNHQWSHRKVKRGEGRKKERRKKGKRTACPVLRMSLIDRYGATDV